MTGGCCSLSSSSSPRLLRPRPSPAPSRDSGRPVGSVQILVDGVPAVDPGLISSETRPGGNLSMAAVRASIAHLYSLARFQDVQVDAISAATGAVDSATT